MIGILAVQGAFIEHVHCLEQLSESYVLIRKKSDIPESLTGLIFPGGESTVQRKLISELDMFDTLKKSIQEGIPVLGTCAGLILLADYFETLPVKVRRNAYGRQLGSFSVNGDIGAIQNFPMRFIRAPYVEEVRIPGVNVLNITDGRITAVQYENQTGVSFHPELTEDLRIHQAFLKQS